MLAIIQHNSSTMFVLKLCIWLLALVASTKAIGFRGFTYEGLREPEVHDKQNRDIPEKWIQQPLDHFNTRDDHAWRMRYYENAEFFNGTGPMVIFLGGEWAISTSYLKAGLPYDVAKNHGAMLYYTEHRYYGRSLPVRNSSAQSLQYLSVDQALADIAYFIETKQREVPGLFNTSVIVIGGSYSGNMAAWARLKYPHLIQGALASSAPIRAKANFHEYYQVVTEALGRYQQQCVDDVKDAFYTIQLLLDTTDGADLVKKIFNLCEAPNSSSSSSLGLFMNALAEQFASTVQYNFMISKNASAITVLCDKMMDTTVGTPIQRLAKILSSSSCIDLSYESFLEYYTNTTWDSPASTVTMRLWYYQTCTEYGYYQTSSGRSIFGNLFPLSFFTRMCSDLYGSYYDSDLVDSGVRRTNLIYGGSLPDLTNVIFTNGNIDPWHRLSVLEDLNDKSPAILIDGSSHCQDLNGATSFDGPELKEAIERVHSIIDGWLNSS